MGYSVNLQRLQATPTSWVFPSILPGYTERSPRGVLLRGDILMSCECRGLDRHMFLRGVVQTRLRNATCLLVRFCKSVTFLYASYQGIEVGVRLFVRGMNRCKETAATSPRSPSKSGSPLLRWHAKVFKIPPTPS